MPQQSTAWILEREASGAVNLGSTRARSDLAFEGLLRHVRRRDDVSQIVKHRQPIHTDILHKFSAPSTTHDFLLKRTGPSEWPLLGMDMPLQGGNTA